MENQNHATPLHLQSNATTNTTTSTGEQQTMLKKKRFSISFDKFTALLILAILFFIGSLSFWIYVQFFI